MPKIISGIREIDGFSNKQPKLPQSGGKVPRIAKPASGSGAWVAPSVGGGGSYTASAVHFDGATFLENASLTITNSRYFASSFWVNPTAQTLSDNRQIVGGDTAPGMGFSFNNGQVLAILFNTGGSDSIQVGSTAIISADTWFNVRTTFDTIAQTAAIYIGAADATMNVSPSGSAVEYDLTGFAIGIPDTVDDDFAMIGDMADFWLNSNMNLNMAVGADGDLFYSGTGKPMNPSGFPAAAILLSGNASTFGTNQGSGGAFTTTGTLTNASTSPSD